MNHGSDHHPATFTITQKHRNYCCPVTLSSGFYAFSLFFLYLLCKITNIHLAQSHNLQREKSEAEKKGRQNKGMQKSDTKKWKEGKCDKVIEPQRKILSGESPKGKVMQRQCVSPFRSVSLALHGHQVLTWPPSYHLQ